MAQILGDAGDAARLCVSLLHRGRRLGYLWITVGERPPTAPYGTPPPSPCCWTSTSSLAASGAAACCGGCRGTVRPRGGGAR
ncbi:hypothetical protein AB0M95_12540 [Sphaerisporangium sp. NPDC051017]|uniref:hypothetical protein n=1 Tax=Sphaerisporangium sp. NPDC051017 TaxID=3154636 RepID=UPI0034404F0B